MNQEAMIAAAAKKVAASLPELTPEKAAHLRYLLGTDTYAPPPPGPPALPPQTIEPPSRGWAQPARKAGVYFIKGGELIKIGVSTDVDNRIKLLQTGSPEQLQLLAVVPGVRADEQDLHKRFGHLRKHGEWFRAAPELLDFISAIGV